MIQLEQELARFKITYFSVIDDNAPHYRYKGDTSDDAKELELRPNKRQPVTSALTQHNGRLASIKRFKSSEPIKEDGSPPSPFQ